MLKKCVITIIFMQLVPIVTDSCPTPTLTMLPIRLHLLAIPHTITRDEYSHCAFTGKVQRFSPMMRSRGFEVYHYGIETSKSGANVDIDLLTVNEWNKLRVESYVQLHPEISVEDAEAKLNDHTQFIGDLGNITTPLYKEFNKRLAIALKQNYRSCAIDIVCLPFGPAHESAIKDLHCVAIETGIGYPNSYKPFRIFESYAKLNGTMQQRNIPIANYFFVIPNYYNILEFPLSLNPDKKKIGFLGRLCIIKGCNIFVDVAKQFPHIDFILCGQGSPDDYLKSPNVHYKPPICGAERGEYLGSLTALIAPSKYIEPFCGVSVEAQLCGTPVITHDYGGLVETVEPFKTGLHCHTLTDFCYGVQMALDGKFDRTYIRNRAVRKYDMYNLAAKYEYVFRNVLNISNGKNGWYAKESYIELLKENVDIR